MIEFIVAFGLLFAIEGLIFAIAPSLAKESMKSASETPVERMRIIGIASAVVGIGLIFVAKRLM